MNQSYNKEDTAADIAIVGLGPGGLAAALEAASSGKKVIVFTDRSEYVRGQRVSLTSQTITFLKKYADDNDLLDTKFFRRIEIEGSAQIKDIEKFMYRKLIQYTNLSIVSLPKELTIKNIGEKQSANFIELTNGRTYFFRNLLASDGANHKLADLLKEQLGKKIEYQQSEKQERHQYHAAVQLKLKNGVKLPTQPSSKGTFIKKMLEFITMGWNETYKPKCYILANENKTKFAFAGEIPQAIFQESDLTQRAEKLRKWAALAIYDQYGIGPEQLDLRYSTHKPNKAQLQATAFEMRLNVSDCSILSLSQGVFSQIGDARRTPNYFVGHGVNDAIKGGIAFIDAMRPEGFNEDEYQAVLRGMDGSIQKEMARVERFSNEEKGSAHDPFIDLIDTLIRKLQQDTIGKSGAIVLLERVRTCFNEGTNFSAIYDAMDKVRPILEEHKNKDIFSLAYRSIMSLFNKNATKTKSAIILDKMEEHLQIYSSRLSH